MASRQKEHQQKVQKEREARAVLLKELEHVASKQRALRENMQQSRPQTPDDSGPTLRRK